MQPQSTMFVWTLLLTVIGISAAFTGCPPYPFIDPCTCQVFIDRARQHFPIVTCENILSEDILRKVLTATKRQRLFEFRLVNSTLRYFPHDVFHETMFEVISMENSSISALSDSNVAFEGLENSLRLLEITNCDFLSNWDWTQLSHLRQLVEIAVLKSDLVDITNGLNTVQHLDFEAFVLRENNIQWLDRYVFAPFQFLYRVTLDKNHVEHIERTMFPRPAPNLTILGLSYNKLSHLPEDIFVDMPALNSLYLNGNPLQVIDEAVFSPIWNQLNLFFFYDTKLSCDCRLTWMYEKEDNDKYAHIACHSPYNLRGRYLETVHPSELLCSYVDY